MAESMRGTRLGRISYQIAPTQDAPTIPTSYKCPAGHTTTLNFSIEADEVPDSWNCHCGVSAWRSGIKTPKFAPASKTPRSHYEMLLERRSVAELEELLAATLRDLRSEHTRVKKSA
jgi:hypothetical protein